MRFTAEQRFPGLDPDRVARAFADPGLFAGYPAGDRLARPEVVAHEAAADGTSVRMQLRFRFTGDLSPAVTAVLDPSRLSWVEDSRHDLAARTTSFVLRPDHYADRLRCEGTVRVVADGDGARRTITGDLKVRALLVGGTVEKVIVGDLQDHLRDEVAVVAAYLRGDG